jgi:gamma-glutamyl hercynylcysteine S-oxide synthase
MRLGAPPPERCVIASDADGTAARRLTGSALADALRESRARTEALVLDLDDRQWQVPEQRGLNPFAWELGHLAWFAEFWVLRGPHGRDADGLATASRPARAADADARFDSSRLAHADRWRTPMPSRAELRELLGAQLEGCLAALPATAASDVGAATGSASADAALYAHRLALFHEDMHAEAFAWTRATLGLPAPNGSAFAPLPPAGSVWIEGAETALGHARDAPGFAFDNERPGRPAVLGGYAIDRTPLSAGDFLRFVEAGGYDQPAYWPGAAGAWRRAAGRSHPERWRRVASAGSPSGAWQARWFDRWLPLEPRAPLIHVNAYEAEAYCRWSGRRLPTAAEWEHAAPRLHWGASVWEWTADAFEPYPGFVPGPYREYSAPWFGDHRELRGGAFATSPRMHHRRYRNFFEPHRSDVFAGFRTVTTG